MILSAFALFLEGMIVGCLMVSMATDLAKRIIPNRLVLVVLVCSIGLRLLSGPSSLLISLLCAIAVLIALGLAASYDLIGWGDVKLISAVTIALPANHVVTLLLAITIAGGLLGCLYLAIRFLLLRMAFTPDDATADFRSLPDLRNLVRREAARILANEPMPYALAVFGGVAYGLAME